VLARIDPQNLRALVLSDNPLGSPDLAASGRPRTPEDEQAARRALEETLALRLWLRQCLRLERLNMRDAALTPPQALVIAAMAELMPSLRELDLGGPALAGLDLAQFARHLRRAPRLQSARICWGPSQPAHVRATMRRAIAQANGQLQDENRSLELSVHDC
jgi:hypothetical protein